MKKTKVLILIVLFFSATLSLYSAFSYQVDFVSRYIWRGFDLNPDKKPALQPQVTYAFGDSGFALNMFLNFSFENKDTNEVDFTLTYDFKTGENFALTLGLTSYDWFFVDNFKFKDHTTQEFFVTAGFPKVLFNPTISLYYDVSLGDGLYAELGLGHSIPISKQVNAELSASIGYNAGQWLPEGVEHGFSDLNLGAAFPFTLGKFNITPFATYTFVLMDFIGNENHFWFGISIAR